MRTSKKIKILVVTSIFHTGGAESITREIFKQLNKQCFEVIFCSLYEPGPTGKRLIADGVHFISNVFRYKVDLLGLFRLRKIICQNNIDIVYIINQPMTSFWVVLVSFLTRVKTIAVSHNTFSLKTDWKLYVYFLVFKLVDSIVTVSTVQKRQIIKEYGQYLAPITVIVNGIDTHQFQLKTEQEKQVGDLCNVGIVARLEYVKGVDVFLDAIQIVIQRGLSARFIIVGGGSRAAELFEYSKRLGIDQYVSFLGERDDVPDLIQNMDITVLSSRSEAMPMAILEYMMLKKPVIATSVGGVGEVISDGLNGFLVEPNDPEELANLIIKLINSPELRVTIGLAGYEYIQRDYTIEVTVDKTQSLFKALVNKPQKT